MGLSAKKFVGKIASDLDKPRGLAVLGGQEACEFLAPKPVSFIWGVGKTMQARLARDGFHRIADLAACEERDLMRGYGSEGLRLARPAGGMDPGWVTPEREAKSVSAETTFDRDVAGFRTMERRLWILCEKVSARLKTANLAGSTITLKLKTEDFRLRTRARTLSDPTQLAARIFAAGRDLLLRETDGTRCRFIGIGVSGLVAAENADPVDLLDPRASRAAAADHALDRLRQKIGGSG